MRGRAPARSRRRARRARAGHPGGAPRQRRRRRSPTARGRRPSRRRRCDHVIAICESVIRDSIRLDQSRISNRNHEWPIPRRPLDLALAVVAAVRADRGAAPSARGTAGTGWWRPRVSASCVRRLAVRVFECRRFGLGMVVSTFLFFSWSSERRQPRILPDRRAVARAGIQIRAALRAQALAILPAQRLHRQRQVELLAHQFARDRSDRHCSSSFPDRLPRLPAPRSADAADAGR